MTSVGETGAIVPGERELLGLADIQEGWRLVERFASLVRESGSSDERRAAEYIADRLRFYNVHVDVYEPELFLSIPRGATLRVLANNAESCFKAKTPSFSLSTKGHEVGVQIPAISDPACGEPHLHNPRAATLRIQ